MPCSSTVTSYDVSPVCPPDSTYCDIARTTIGVDMKLSRQSPTVNRSVSYPLFAPTSIRAAVRLSDGGPKSQRCQDILNQCMEGCWKEDPNAKFGCQMGCTVSYSLCK